MIIQNKELHDILSTIPLRYKTHICAAVTAGTDKQTDKHKLTDYCIHTSLAHVHQDIIAFLNLYT